MENVYATSDELADWENVPTDDTTVVTGNRMQYTIAFVVFIFSVIIFSSFRNGK